MAIHADAINNYPYPVMRMPKEGAAIYEKFKQKPMLELTIPDLPEVADNSEYEPPLVDQEAQGACSFFSFISLYGYYQIKQDWPCYTPLSAEALYYWYREKYGDINIDDGGYPDDIAKIAKSKGIPPEFDGINDDANFLVKPPKEAEIDAKNFRIKSYKALPIGTSKYKSSDLLAQAIAKGDAVEISLGVTDSLFSPDPNGIVDLDGTGYPRIAHAVLALGYKPDPNRPEEKLFYCQNTWGEAYGLEGRMWLTEDFINKFMFDALTIQVQSQAPTGKTKLNYVQSEGYDSQSDAESICEEINSKGFNAKVVETDGEFAVEYGAYKSDSYANTLAKRIKDILLNLKIIKK